METASSGFRAAKPSSEYFPTLAKGNTHSFQLKEVTTTTYYEYYDVIVYGIYERLKCYPSLGIKF